MTTTPATITAPVAVSEKALTWFDSEPIIYGGPSDKAGWSSLIVGRRVERQCDADRIAPADTPVPAKDPRVEVTKRTTREARAANYYGRGSWSYTIPGYAWTMRADTKRAALADGARRLAILDWHAAQAAATATRDLTGWTEQPCENTDCDGT